MATRCGPVKRPSAADLAGAENLFKALADEHRLRILATIVHSGGEVCVCELTEALPLLQPTVSHHLKILREAELVTSERRGSWVYYRIDPNAEARLQQMADKIIGSKRRLGKAM